MAKFKVDPEALAFIREHVPPGSKVKTTLRHVSRSGMQREISCFIVVDGSIRCIDWAVAGVTGYKIGKHGGLVVGGCGMDMGFHLVYTMSSIVYGGGYKCLGDRRCPSNYHCNLHTWVTCQTCDGTGGHRDEEDSPCPTCGGRGRVSRSETESFDLVHIDGYAVGHDWM